MSQLLPRFALFVVCLFVLTTACFRTINVIGASPKPDGKKTTTPPSKNDGLQKIESTRGGRHWIDNKTAPPRSPEESRIAFEVEPGFEVQLVAAEPIIKDPVAITFDQNGQLFAVEYADYPIGATNGTPLSKVVLLEDTNHDGRYDKRHLFADKLLFAHSLMPYKEGLLVGTSSEIIYLKDSNGDHHADIRKTLFSGFTQAHAQMHIGNPRWGIDNWISLNYGRGLVSPGDAKAKKDAKKTVKIPRRDFLFHPITLNFKPDGGWGQFGNTIDRWGHRFYNTNRNPIKTTRIPYEIARRNPFAVISKTETDVAPSGGAATVFPIIEMKSNYLSHAGTHTSACGVTAYTGDLFGEKFFNSVFVCEPVGNLITRSIVLPEEKGSGLTAKRARPKADFLTSRDPWFRPGSLANGPDGALYVADMYRLWVEHPKFVPKDVAEKMDFRAGADRGRIWRIVPQNTEKNNTIRPFTPPKTTQQQIALLSDSNSWRRFLGQRLLVEQQAVDAEAELRSLLQKAPDPLTRLHALWTLDGIGKLTFEDQLGALSDKNKFVRRDAVKLIAPLLINEQSPSSLRRQLIYNAFNKLASDPERQVRFEVAIAIGNLSENRMQNGMNEAVIPLKKILLSDGNDPWLIQAVLTSCKTNSGALLVELWKDQTFTKNAQPWKANVVRQLATVVGTRGEEAELKTVLDQLTQPSKPQWWQNVAISGLAAGLPRHRGKLKQTSLSRLIQKPPATLKMQAGKVKQLLDQSSQIALDRSQDVPPRLAAIELLGFQPYKNSLETYKELLVPNQPVSIQIACINAMQNGKEDAARLILERWSQFGPSVREPALTILFRNNKTVLLFFEAVQKGQIERNVVSIDQRVRFLKHRDPKIKALATKLLGGAVSPNRKAVAKKYQAALTLKPSLDSGAKVFEKTCSKCHKRNGKGTAVGPDISDVRNRSQEALLFDILDPNSKVEPRFADYIIITQQGTTVNGLLLSETVEAVVIRQAGGKEVIVPRTNILKMQATGKSLMPEGVEKEITIQQMADLLAFLKSGQ